MSDAQTTDDAPDTKARRPGRLITLAAILIVAVGGAGAGVWYFGMPGQNADGPSAAPARPPIYYTLDDNLIVNFRPSGSVRYLQLGIDLMARDPRTIDALRTHAPVVRNRLILLLSDQSPEELAGREAKESLQQAALAEVRAVLDEVHGGTPVEALFFTTFVMQ